MTLADDRLLVHGPAGDEDVRFPVALSGGSHHADWFEAFIPQLARLISLSRRSMSARLPRRSALRRGGGCYSDHLSDADDTPG